MLIVKLDENFTDTALTVLKRDLLLEDANDGVLYLADLSKRYCFAGAGGSTPPASGEAIASLTEANAGVMRRTGGGALAYAGNGLDFGAVTSNQHLEIPAAVLADIWASANQYFLVCVYVKLPAQADWNSAGSIGSFFAGESPYTSQPDLVVMSQLSTGQDINVVRQTAVGAVDNMNINVASADFGQFAQLAFWRTAAGQRAQLRTANGITLSSALAANANNSANFSTKKILAGVHPSWIGSAASTKWKLYRTFIENLVTSGRDPQTVLNADYDRVVAAGAFT